MFLINQNNILGIVTEYNPFHNGHLYHLETSKQHTQSHGVVAIMSGHFTQRGEPAIADPWTRASWALQCGVDLVIELPTVFATSSAPYFAHGAISVLNALNCIDSICFGSESGDINQLISLQNLLNTGADELNSQIKNNASRSFSVQRSEHLASKGQSDSALSKANDILGLAYLDALNRTNSEILPTTIHRLIAGYHDESITNNIASATAIRKVLQNDGSAKTLSHTLPKCTFDYFNNLSVNEIGPNNSLWQEWCLFYLRQTSLEQLSQVHDMADGLAQRMKQAATESNSYATFEERLKTKIFTNGRLKRVMAKMLLGISKQDLQNDCLTPPTYIRILGFNETGRQILNQASPTLPIITNGKHFRPDTPLAKRQWEIDCLAADLYALLSNTAERKGGINFRKPPVYIK